MNNLPAALGGTPVFDEPLPIIRPNAHMYWKKPEFQDALEKIFSSNMLTGPLENEQRFEKAFADVIGAPHAIALSSCTDGLMLAIQALGAAEKEVILPSFTFSATAHAAAWNRCKFVFADIDDTLCLDPDDVEQKITENTALIIAVHMYGLPCDVERFEKISKQHNIPVLYDSAHATGSSVDGAGIGTFGTAAAFSFSPAKLITTVEGGMLVTRDAELARKIRLDRNYSNPPDYQCERPGLSSRMGEVSAALGFLQVADLAGFVRNRNAYTAKYTDLLVGVPGVSFQRIPDGRVSTCYDFSVFVDSDVFGMDRDLLGETLARENIATKKYFYPPIHRLAPYGEYASASLPVTDEKAGRVLSLPIYNVMEDGIIEKVAHAIRRIHENAPAIVKKPVG